jgi:hypothetical protein
VRKRLALKTPGPAHFRRKGQASSRLSGGRIAGGRAAGGSALALMALATGGFLPGAIPLARTSPASLRPAPRPNGLPPIQPARPPARNNACPFFLFLSCVFIRTLENSIRTDRLLPPLRLSLVTSAEPTRSARSLRYSSPRAFCCKRGYRSQEKRRLVDANLPTVIRVLFDDPVTPV